MKTTVFICTYNRGNLINNTLKGIIENQSLLPEEIVVVNGGGENDCSETLDYWKTKFKGLREIKTQNVNLANSRNIGLPQCTGDLIIQTDDDAVPFPDWIELLVKAHSKYPNAGVIGGEVVDASGDSLLFKVADATTFPHYDKMVEVRSVPGVNSSYRKEVIAKVGSYDTTLFRGEDVDYNWRAIQLGYKVLYFPNIKVYHHHRASWKGLFNQHYMYGRAYYLVRKKWQNMYCAYPRKIDSTKMFLKGIYYWVQPFFDGASKLKYIDGFFNQLKAYPIIIAIQYRWRKGVLDQKNHNSNI
ncbi:glycosyltransferase [uncultured Polaribacter sp.]|uniref:glycosyltransferase family 2 protein n=1 Tax=uncultured Polaribacter sp. TaxID=174711 RepID=UPI00259B8CCE|nr:glycosyltransferase [uncultured Polaribacter sp.]